MGAKSTLDHWIAGARKGIRNDLVTGWFVAPCENSQFSSISATTAHIATRSTRLKINGTPAPAATLSTEKLIADPFPLHKRFAVVMELCCRSPCAPCEALACRTASPATPPTTAAAWQPCPSSKRLTPATWLGGNSNQHGVYVFAQSASPVPGAILGHRCSVGQTLDLAKTASPHPGQPARAGPPSNRTHTSGVPRCLT